MATNTTEYPSWYLFSAATSVRAAIAVERINSWSTANNFCNSISRRKLTTNARFKIAESNWLLPRWRTRCTDRKDSCTDTMLVHPLRSLRGVSGNCGPTGAVPWCFGGAGSQATCTEQCRRSGSFSKSATRGSTGRGPARSEAPSLPECAPLPPPSQYGLSQRSSRTSSANARTSFNTGAMAALAIPAIPSASAPSGSEPPTTPKCACKRGSNAAAMASAKSSTVAPSGDKCFWRRRRPKSGNDFLPEPSQARVADGLRLLEASPEAAALRPRRLSEGGEGLDDGSDAATCRTALLAGTGRKPAGNAKRTAEAPATASATASHALPPTSWMTPAASQLSRPRRHALPIPRPRAGEPPDGGDRADIAGVSNQG
mmetsp:Transcript_68540/g.198884  ORF Transcript_68540/g.198884 Transcript_68540/m.198884 type:complete len:372 (+) Transcript_68540:1090-2205(+)